MAKLIFLRKYFEKWKHLSNVNNEAIPGKQRPDVIKLQSLLDLFKKGANLNNLFFFVFFLSQLFNLNDTKENQTNSDNSQWNDAEAKFVARLAQAVCAELSSEAMKSYTDRPRTCGIITFYQKQRSTICLELQKLGIKVVDDPSNRWSKNNHHKDRTHTTSQAVSVKTVDGFQVSQKGQKSLCSYLY